MPFIRPTYENDHTRADLSKPEKRNQASKRDVPSAFYIDMKVVPGARREQISGLLGNRLKVRVSAPPEGGKANKAVCRLMAKKLGIKAGCITLVSGTTSTEKTLRIEGISAEELRKRLGVVDSAH